MKKFEFMELNDITANESDAYYFITGVTVGIAIGSLFC